jgi:Zinc carboxypeptidase
MSILGRLWSAKKNLFFYFIFFLSLCNTALSAQQPIDSVYTARIHELTPLDPRYTSLTDLVDYLPASSTVPTPLQALGYVPGTVGRLSYVADMNRYLRTLAEKTPRVKVFTLGTSDEGRELVVAAIGDEEAIAHLDDARAALARLDEPRGLDSATRVRLVHDSKAIYWLTGSIHSAEVGSPEMLMELAYRLAVDESDYVRGIRANVITLITPAMEVDGRDRVVDVVKLAHHLELPVNDILEFSRDDDTPPQGVPLIYWGKYTMHDSNRDAIALSQRLSRQYMQGLLSWHPTVVHDLHESIAFLYASTGTGPYNPEFDPIVVDEWNTLAAEEETELTRRGLPGVWTHGYYDGWAPDYTVIAAANLHNSIGRFYETYTAFGADCGTSRLTVRERARRWDRPSPPLNGVRWCIRSNINYQQAGALVALHYVAEHRQTFLENYAAKARRMVARGRTTAPYAYVIPRAQRHAAEAADLVNLFRLQGAEVQVADTDGTLAGAALVGDTAGTHTTPRPMPAIALHRGDWIVRLDQPNAAPVRTLLAIQRYRKDDPPPFDELGWTLDAVRQVETEPVGDSAVFRVPVHILTTDATVVGTQAGTGATAVVRPLGDWRTAMIPWRVAPTPVTVADTAFTMDGAPFPAGTFVIRNASAAVRSTLTALGADVLNAAPPAIATHPITLPRIAVVHTWIETQNEGWVRYTFDRIGIPYTYISDQVLRTPHALDRFDVVVFPHVHAVGNSLLNGRPVVGVPIPWKASALTPNLGHWDESDDIRGGMGLEGMAALRRFVEHGGLLVTEGAVTQLVVNLGFSATVSAAPPSQALPPGGSVYRATVVAPWSPVLYGYEATFPVYSRQTPLLSVAPVDTLDYGGPMDTATTRQAEHLRARVLLAFHARPDSVLFSGFLGNTAEPAGRPAVIDAPLGKGHVVLFAIRPTWRWETQGTFGLVINALANWNALDGATLTSTR